MKIKALCNFYTKVLTEVGVVDGGSGKLSYVRGDVLAPVTLGGKRLCLPTRENLKELDMDTNLVFHPTSEQIISGPSPVLNELRNYITVRLTTTAMSISKGIVELAADPKRQAKLPSAAMDIMKNMSNADAKVSTVLDSVFEKVSDSLDTRIYNLFLKNRGSKADPKGLRTTTVSFPIMDTAYDGDPEKFFGVKMPRKTRDKPAIVALLEYVLDYEAGEENYIKEYTTSEPQAPYLHTLLMCFKDIAEHQNKIIKVFKKHIPELQELMYNLDWIEEFDDFSNFVDKVGLAVPLLPGNLGKTNKAEEEESEEDDTKSISWTDIKDDISDEPVIVNLPVDRQSSSSGKKDWRSLLSGDRDRKRDEGLTFGRTRERSRQSGFDTLGSEERERRDYDRADPYGRNRGRERNRGSSFRDVLSTTTRRR